MLVRGTRRIDGTCPTARAASWMRRTAHEEALAHDHHGQKHEARQHGEDEGNGVGACRRHWHLRQLRCERGKQQGRDACDPALSQASSVMNSMPPSSDTRMVSNKHVAKPRRRRSHRRPRGTALQEKATTTRHVCASSATTSPTRPTGEAMKSEASR